MFLDDTACNLASLNLMRYVGADGQFDIEAFKHAVAGSSWLAGPSRPWL